MGASDDEEDYITYGQPLGEEQHSVAGQYRKDGQDPALTKALPVWQQVRSCGSLTNAAVACQTCTFSPRPKQLALQLTADQNFPFTGGHKTWRAAGAFTALSLEDTLQGFFNTVGSKEGWAPATFKSSREQRAGSRC